MNAPAYVDLERARAMPGLRLVLGRGVPGPWSVAAKAIFDIKGINYVPVAHDAGAANEEVTRWTGQTSAPVAMLDDERPRAHWSEILLLAERLRPHPPLIPAAADERMLMFGLCHELGGEDGLGWTLRCLLFAAQQASGNIPYPSLLTKYSSGLGIEHHRHRLNAILTLLSDRLAAQTAAGSPYLVGRSLSAADVYWLAFSNLIEPLSPAQCEMPDFYRGLGELARPYLDAPLSKALVEQRDLVFERHIGATIAF